MIFFILHTLSLFFVLRLSVSIHSCYTPSSATTFSASPFEKFVISVYADGMTFCKVMVSDLIEKNATPEQKAAHIDIADWIIFQIRESRINCTADHLVEAERILQRMIEKNPALQKLIDDLGLVLVGASSIGSGDGNPP